MRLKDKVAIVTGAGSGIGEKIAQTFAREGAKVVIADLDIDAANKVAQAISSHHHQAMALKMDVTNEAEVDNGVEQVIKAFGEIDVLVSNAGIQHIDPIDKLAFKDWQTLLNIQLNGAFLTTRACIRSMYRSGKGGSIIYMGSVHSKEASALKAPYVTAKHGLIGLCEVVAKEGAAHQVRANVICPGYVHTPLVDKQLPSQARDLHMSEADVIKNVMLKDTLDGEFTTTKDVADVALFFAAFDSLALTGQSLIVSHGWFMQ